MTSRQGPAATHSGRMGPQVVVAVPQAEPTTTIVPRIIVRAVVVVSSSYSSSRSSSSSSSSSSSNSRSTSSRHKERSRSKSRSIKQGSSPGGTGPGTQSESGVVASGSHGCTREVRPSPLSANQERTLFQSSSNSSGSSRGSSNGHRWVSSNDDGWRYPTEERTSGALESPYQDAQRRKELDSEVGSHDKDHRRRDTSTPSPQFQTGGQASPWHTRSSQDRPQRQASYRSRSNSIDSTCSRGSQYSRSTCASDCS